MSVAKINITFECFTFRRLAVTGIIRRCIQETLRAEGVAVSCEINVLVLDQEDCPYESEINLILTTDEEIHRTNKEFRDIDRPTDVLSFPMFQLEAGVLPDCWNSYMDPETDRCPLGDMAISLERAMAQAKEFGHSIRREVGYLTIHSMLHLLGYDHLDEGPMKKQMRAREEAIAATIEGMSRE